MFKIVFLLLAFVSTPALSGEIPTGEIQVVDGDTIKMDGVSYRLMGFDTPETFYAKCASERELGNKATARLIELLAPPAAVVLQDLARPIVTDAGLAR